IASAAVAPAALSAHPRGAGAGAGNAHALSEICPSRAVSRRACAARRTLNEKMPELLRRRISASIRDTFVRRFRHRTRAHRHSLPARLRVMMPCRVAAQMTSPRALARDGAAFARRIVVTERTQRLEFGDETPQHFQALGAEPARDLRLRTLPLRPCAFERRTS